jgi:hypothetical protein
MSDDLFAVTTKQYLEALAVLDVINRSGFQLTRTELQWKRILEETVADYERLHLGRV